MKDRENFFEVWGGISGCQHLVTLLLDSSIPLERVVDLTSKQVAERFRLNQKGEIAIGKDADFAVVDLNAEETITGDSLLYRHQHSPYVGWLLRGRVIQTVLRGETIFGHGKPSAKPKGRFVQPNRT